MEKKQISKIINFVKETDLTEFSLEKNESKIYFRRRIDHSKGQKFQNGSTAVLDEEQIKNEAEEEKKKFTPICSVMVGTFYHSISKDRPPFVIEGNTVMPGQKIGVIEAMKIMKDVLSTVEGKIVKILVENNNHVEYGQELFLVDTSVKGKKK
ncbi:MAG: biotin/lipoyl-containing protein [bacterium]